MLSNKEGSAAKGFFYAAVFWLIVPVFAGLLMAILLSYPTLQTYIPDLLKTPINFGRLRPMHVNLAIFGWLSMAYVAGIFYIVPRLTGAKLLEADLSGTNLSGTNLSGADLSRANLNGANMIGTNLTETNLDNTDLSGADLSGADLDRARLSWADLSEVDLRGASLRGARLDKITREFVVSCEQEQTELCEFLRNLEEIGAIIKIEKVC